jgi:hypothetical protein
MTKCWIALRLLLAASFISCGMSTVALSQTAAKRAQDRSEKALSDKEIEESRLRVRAQADKRQKDWDVSSATTMKSICSNC